MKLTSAMASGGPGNAIFCFVFSSVSWMVVKCDKPNMRPCVNT